MQNIILFLSFFYCMDCEIMLYGQFILPFYLFIFLIGLFIVSFGWFILYVLALSLAPA